MSIRIARHFAVVTLVLFLLATAHAPLRADEPSGAAPTGRAIKSLKRLEDTVKRFGGHGDNWHMSWADNDKVYVSLCDGSDLPGTPPGNFNSRMYAIAGDMPNLKFEFLPGYPQLPSGPGRDTNRYYNFGTLALDGRQVPPPA